MTYEVLEILPSATAQTVFASESYDDCFEQFKTIYERDGAARIDVVVRETEYGRPVFRQIALEAENSTHYDNRGYVSAHSDDYGTFGPCVYCPEHRDKPWAGLECYSREIKTFNYQ
jgi:hypothetical protein